MTSIITFAIVIVVADVVADVVAGRRREDRR